MIQNKNTKKYNRNSTIPKKSVSVSPVSNTSHIPNNSTAISSVSSSSNGFSQNNGGFLSTILEGFSFGIGSSIANRTVDSILGPKKIIVEKTNMNTNVNTNENKSDDNCEILNQKYLDCTKNLYGGCEDVLINYNNCIKNLK